MKVCFESTSGQAKLSTSHNESPTTGRLTSQIESFRHHRVHRTVKCLVDTKVVLRIQNLTCCNNNLIVTK
jgi:hypothetical protein